MAQNVLYYAGSILHLHGLPVVAKDTCTCPRCDAATMHLHISLWRAHGEPLELLHVRPASLSTTQSTPARKARVLIDMGAF